MRLKIRCKSNVTYALQLYRFVPYWSYLLSREVQLGVADEIIARVHEKAAEIEAGNGRGA